VIASGTLSATPLSAPNVREKIAGSAAALFQRFGYAHVSIRDITSSVDIPKGTFYSHFTSKEALTSAILSHHFNSLLETLRDAGKETPSSHLSPHFRPFPPPPPDPRLSPPQPLT